MKCPDCDVEIDIPKDVEKGEIISCPSCGLEFEVKENGELQEVVMEGEDWGE